MNTRGTLWVNWLGWDNEGGRGQGTQGIATGNASLPSGLSMNVSQAIESVRSASRGAGRSRARRQATFNMIIAMKRIPFCSTVFAFALVACLAGLSGCTRESPQTPPLTKVVVAHNPNPPPLAMAAPSQAPAVALAAEAPQAEAPTATVVAQRVPMPPTVDEVIDLAQSQVGDAVLIEYIKKSTTPFELSADQVIYLNDIGLSEQVLTVLVERSRELQSAAAVQAAPAAAALAPEPAPAPAQPAPPVYVESAPAPATVPAEAPQTVYSQPVTQVTQNYYYSALSPYGAWVEIPSYGWCWRPTVAVMDPYWRPYFHGGRWLYTDSGWYWQSSYSWGWAPFHYGTWYQSPVCGWVWAPGYTWAPAWVTWRYTDAYCGWAPLPPGCGWGAGIGLTFHGSRVSVGFSFGLGWDYFNFVHYNHFCDPHPYRHRLPRHEITTVYNNSTVINNYHYGKNSTVINNGIPPQRITAVTRSEIRKVQIRDVTGEPDAPRRADRLERDGRQVAVYRPQPSAVSPGQPTPASRHTGSASSIAGTASGVGAPLISGRARSDTVQPTRTTTPANASPARPAAAPTRTVTSTPTRQAPPAAGNVSPSRVNQTVSPPSRTSSQPARTTAPSQPSRVERAPSTRTTSPSISSGVSTPATRSTPSASVPSPQRSPSQTGTQSRTPTRVTTSPSQPRSLPSAAPSSAPSRSSSQGQSLYRSGTVTVGPSVGPPMSTRSTPVYQSPSGSSPARSATPSYSAPSRSMPSRSPAPSYSPPASSAPSRSVAPSYSPPSRGTPSAPAPSSRSGGSSRSPSGRD